MKGLFRRGRTGRSPRCHQKKLGGEYRETRTLHLPGGDTRTLILCKKISQTPTAYPRNGGKIAKSPLK